MIGVTDRVRLPASSELTFLFSYLPRPPQTSASLQHVPLDLNLETELPTAVKSRLAFAQQKLEEMVAVKEAVTGHAGAASDIDLSTYTGAPAMGLTAKAIPTEFFQRPAPFAVRRPQQPQFHAFPTTTVAPSPPSPVGPPAPAPPFP